MLFLLVFLNIAAFAALALWYVDTPPGFQWEPVATALMLAAGIADLVWMMRRIRRSNAEQTEKELYDFFFLGFNLEETLNLVRLNRFECLDVVGFVSKLMDKEAPGNPQEALNEVWRVNEDVAKLSDRGYRKLCSELSVPADPAQADGKDLAVFLCGSAIQPLWNRIFSDVDKLKLPAEFLQEKRDLWSQAMRVVAQETRSIASKMMGGVETNRGSTNWIDLNTSWLLLLSTLPGKRVLGRTFADLV